MRLDVSFDPDQRPEVQHALRQIPSADRVEHSELKAALESYEQARAAEHEARRTHTQLEQELPAAEYQDELALADAREKGARDPGPKNAERHRKAIAEARRDWGARKIALGRAVEGVVQAFDRLGDDWEDALSQQRDELRAEMAELLSKWQEKHAALQVNTANRAMLRGSGSASRSATLFAASFKVPAVRDGNVIAVADVLDGLRGLAAPQEPNPSAVENIEPGAEPTRRPVMPERPTDPQPAERKIDREVRRQAAEA